MIDESVQERREEKVEENLSKLEIPQQRIREEREKRERERKRVKEREE